jgi:dimeric dUTPase (all-alpha-NTP-PPase superfamily)
MNKPPESGKSDDMLRSLFAMQVKLNDYVFQKHGLRDNDGKPLTMKAIADNAENGQLLVNDLPCQWLGRYTKAIEEELVELKDDLLWKWWSKDEIDIQNIRVELVDIFHFLVSTMLCAGITADKLYDIYRQKNAVNLARQDAGYSKKTKTEDDNRGIE